MRKTFQFQSFVALSTFISRLSWLLQNPQGIFCNHDVSQGCRAPTGRVQAVVLYLATESVVTRVVRQKGSLQRPLEKGKQMKGKDWKEQRKNAKCEFSNCFDCVSRLGPRGPQCAFFHGPSEQRQVGRFRWITNDVRMVIIVSSTSDGKCLCRSI